ncbi:sporulation membrane protein YtaF [Mesobacillus jeotgali]|uniref:sporulation membrane protein YtaF n=1 Tax=Mesobacillus jeotgali TaxID=129985 RepID=UPI0009A65FAC|nr:sporulation membrane protein YtaF [Mesobacillus jeotgali]
MAQIISLLLLAFAVSLDSFSVGLTYGLRRMIIPVKSIAVIAACSAVVLMAAMMIGHFLESFFSPEWAETLGGAVLIVLGGWVLFQFFRDDQTELLSHEKIILNFEIKSLGIVINILKKPMSADFDRSGTINGIEAVMLGLALSLDAFGAGIGAALLGFSPGYLALTVACMSSLFVYAGMKMGSYFSESGWLQKFSFVPGILLIIIGLFKL